MAAQMVDGFDHTEYRDEVERRWGAGAYARSDAWWQGMTNDERGDWQAASAQLGRDWVALAHSGAASDSPEAQELAARHVAWLREIPGTPAADPDGNLVGYVRGLAEIYVADERFAANYGGVDGAAFVRDALLAFVGS